MPLRPNARALGGRRLQDVAFHGGSDEADVGSRRDRYHSPAVARAGKGAVTYPPAPRPSTVSGMPSYRQPGTVLTDHHFEVPLNHADPAGPQIIVFAREVVAIENPAPPPPHLPCLPFLTRGPPPSRPPPTP